MRVRRQRVGARARARKAACPGGTHVHLVEAQREVWSKVRDAPGDTASKRTALKSSGDLRPIATSARFRVVRWRNSFQAKEARDIALALVLVQVLPARCTPGLLGDLIRLNVWCGCGSTPISCAAMVSSITQSGTAKDNGCGAITSGLGRAVLPASTNY